MILDDLFTFASQNYVAGAFDVTVMASVTTNRTGGLQTQANSAAATNELSLTYHPSEVTFLHEAGAYFSGNGLTISAPLLEPYRVWWQASNSPKTAVATVDATTNVIYAILGTEFVTVSLCGILKKPIAQ
jgi:hypothetical protein